MSHCQCCAKRQAMSCHRVVPPSDCSHGAVMPSLDCGAAVLPVGGPKGRTATCNSPARCRTPSTRLCTPPARIKGEYGMASGHTIRRVGDGVGHGVGLSGFSS
jgi:hypothetical protein